MDKNVLLHTLMAKWHHIITEENSNFDYPSTHVQKKEKPKVWAEQTCPQKLHRRGLVSINVTPHAGGTPKWAGAAWCD